MAERLSDLCSKYLSDAVAFRKAHSAGVLIWTNKPALSSKELLWNTQGHNERTAEGEPLVYDLEKDPQKANAFGIGITLGRTANNDIEVDDSSVSRFHAYFQRDAQSGVWHVVDAESFNGTFCDGNRLQPNRPAPLADGAQLRFGSAQVLFFSPPAFEAYLEGVADKAS